MEDVRIMKSFYRLCKREYPSIVQELTPKPVLNNFKSIPDLLNRYCELSGSTIDDVRKNRNNERLVFIAVVVKAFDPISIDDIENLLPRGLRIVLSDVLHCHTTQISNSIQTVRTFMKIYADFRDRVSYFYSEIIKR